MKKWKHKRAAALVCIFSLLLTIGATGCNQAQNENGASSDTVSTAEASAEQSGTSQASSEQSSRSQSSSEQSSKSQSSSEQSSKSQSSSEQSSRSQSSSEQSSRSQSSSEQSSRSQSSSEQSSRQQSYPEQSSRSESSDRKGEETSDDFTYSENSSGGITLTKYSGREASPVIPSTLGGKRVSAIGESCFAGNTAVRTVVIPEGVSEIGDYAFECCAHLEGITFPDSLRSIGEGAFSACTELSEIRLPDDLEVIKKGAFLYCQSLGSLVLPSGLREVGNFAFSNCSKITSVTFNGDRLRNLPDRLFYSCSKLSEINISHTLDSIGKRTFGHCNSLTSVAFPGQLRSVSAYAFDCCERLTSVSIHADNIDEYAYFGCYSLPEEMLPEPVDEPQSSSQEGGSVRPPLPDTVGSIAGSSSLYDENKHGRYRIVESDEFEAWSRNYISFCQEKGVPVERDELFYTMLYKGEVIPHYMGMTSAENHDPSMSRDAANAFGDDYQETYLMMDHGLYTELKRGRMCDDLVIYSGVYDSQLMDATGTSTVPSLEQLKDRIGSTFTDRIMISTTTEIVIACHFSDTLFIIYASMDSLDRLGAISIDSIIGSSEKEILLSKNATYRILDVGTMKVRSADDGEEGIYGYVKLELL